MRKCKGIYLEKGQFHIFKEGYFHQWGVDYEQYGDECVGNFSVAIIELPDGKVVEAKVDDIQFLD